MLQLENQTPFKAAIARAAGSRRHRHAVRHRQGDRDAAAGARAGGGAGARRRWPTSTTAIPRRRACARCPTCTSASRAPMCCSSAARGRRTGGRYAQMQVVDDGGRRTKSDPRHRRSRLAGRSAVRSAAVRVDAARLGTCVRRLASDAATQVLAEERNPVGCGFAGGRSAGEMQGLAGAEPRGSGGAAPADRSDARAGVPRADRAVVAAAPRVRGHVRRARGSAAGRRICRTTSIRASFSARRRSSRSIATCRAGEPVEVSGVMPDGPIAFTIPDARLGVAVTVAGATEEPPANLETLSIEPDENRACFTWRAAVPCDRQALEGRERSSSARSAAEQRS